MEKQINRSFEKICIDFRLLSPNNGHYDFRILQYFMFISKFNLQAQIFFTPSL